MTLEVARKKGYMKTRPLELSGHQAVSAACSRSQRTPSTVYLEADGEPLYPSTRRLKTPARLIPDA
jgi:hypothetical protein